ncbi:hypothetical protein O5D80_003738 [Batrachochytrium dendrobatidis]|nr:hypothetical protein O5D80_003738 [Batrachochytrium dendrobatidis]
MQNSKESPVFDANAAHPQLQSQTIAAITTPLPSVSTNRTNSPATLTSNPNQQPLSDHRDVHHLYEQVITEVHSNSVNDPIRPISHAQGGRVAPESNPSHSQVTSSGETLKSASEATKLNSMVFVQLDSAHNDIKSAVSNEPALSYVGGESRVGVDGAASATMEAGQNVFLDDQYPPSIHKYNEDEFEFRGFSLRRTLSRFSRHSKRTFISNMSVINRHNLRRFGRSKVAFLIANTIFVLAGVLALLYGVLTYTGSPIIISLWGSSIVVALMVSGSLQVLFGIVGYFGALLHRKTLLIFFMVAIWPLVFGYLYVGYSTYRQLNATQWEKSLSDSWSTLNTTRGSIQAQYNCCGFLSSFDRPFADSKCPTIIHHATSANIQASSSMVELTKRQAPDPNAAPQPPAPDPNAAPQPPAPDPNAAPQPPTPDPNAAPQPPTPDPNAAPPPSAPGNPIISPIASPNAHGSSNSLPGCHDPWREVTSSYLRTSYIVAFSIVAYLFSMFVILILGTNHIYMD